MKIREITDKNEYVNLWKKTEGHFMQSYAWSEAKDTGLGFIYIVIEDDGNPLSVVTIHKKRILNGIINFGYAPKTRLSETELNQIEAYLKTDHQLDFVIFEQDKKLEQGKNTHDKYKNIQPQFTNIVDVSISEDELWMNLKAKYRRNIKKALRHDLTISYHTEGKKPIDELFEIMSFIFTNSTYVMHGKDYFFKVWKALSDAKLGKIVLAKTKDGKLAGAYLLAYDLKAAYELYGGTNDIGRNTEAGYLLKWSAILDAHNMGLKNYDHWGTEQRIGETYKQGELHNISKFKEGFGGDYVEFTPSEVIINSGLKFKMFKLLDKARGLYLLFRKAL